MNQYIEEISNAVDTTDEKEWLSELDRLDQEFDTLFMDKIIPAQAAGDKELVLTLDTQSGGLLTQMNENTGKLIAAFDREVTEATNEAARAAADTTTWMVATAAVAAGSGIAIGLLLSRSSARPIQDVARIAARIADGDLRPTVAIRAGGEVGDMARAFQKMLANLRDMARQVQQNASEVAAASQQIMMASEQSAMATGQVTATVQQIAQGTAQQSATVNQTSVMVEQVSRSIEGVARGAQEQAISVTQTAEVTSQISSVIEQVTANAQNGASEAARAAQAATDGAKTVEETIEGMQSIKQAQDQALTRVREMGQRSEQIGVIVETIEDIASQTNLLALNANIEAARAGEHGKGFAVVAGEVGKLASDAKDATKEIAALVKNIQQSVNDVVQAMNAGSVEVTAGVTRAQKSGQALSDILRTVEVVNRQVNEIATAMKQMNTSANAMVSSLDAVSAVVEESTAATEEMASSAEQVLGAVSEIASISEENSASTEEVSASVEEVSAQAEAVTASAQALNAMAQQLRSVVARFKLPEA